MDPAGQKAAGVPEEAAREALQNSLNMIQPYRGGIWVLKQQTLRRFVRVEPGDDEVPDESTILRFRHLLEREALTEGIFDV